MAQASAGRRLLVLGGIFGILAAISVFTLDGPLARFDVGRLPGDLRRLVALSEVFAHGLGVAMILVAAWVLDHDRRLLIPRVAVLAFLPGLIVNACKLLVSRQRPVAWGLQGNAAGSFLGIPGHPSEWTLQSFPSGHTATAVGLALGLSVLYPQGRQLFAVLAVLAAAQRVLFDAHFLSDALAAAAVACIVSALLRERLLWDNPR